MNLFEPQKYLQNLNIVFGQLIPMKNLCDPSLRLVRVEYFTTETNNPQGFFYKTLDVKPQELSPM
jgi:hypothetical protein